MDPVASRPFQRVVLDKGDKMKAGHRISVLSPSIQKYISHERAYRCTFLGMVLKWRDGVL